MSGSASSSRARVLVAVVTVVALLVGGAVVVARTRTAGPDRTAAGARRPQVPAAIVREKQRESGERAAAAAEGSAEGEEPGEPVGEGEIVDGAAAQAVDARAYPRGYVTTERALAGRKAFRRLPSAGSGRTVRSTADGEGVVGSPGSGGWTALGPVDPVVPDVVTYTGRATTTSGRVTALAIAPTCTTGNCRLWVGAAGGGVWRTDDALATVPTWTPVSTGLTSNAIGSLLVDPNDATGNTLYAGTGEPNGSSDSEAGVGLFRSTDGGDHWSLVSGSVPVAKDRSIGAIAVDPSDPDRIWIGTAMARHGSSSVNGGRRTPPDAPTLGVYRSTDGGSTFTLQLSEPGSANPPAGGTDWFQGGVTKLVWDPANAGQLYATLIGYGIYRTGNPMDPSGWSQVYETRYPDDTFGARVEFDLVDDGGTTRIYVGDSQDDYSDPVTELTSRAALLVADGVDGTSAADLSAASREPIGPPWVLRSSDSIKDPGGFSSYRFCQSQCGYDTFVVADPNNPDTVWLGGAMNYDELWGPAPPRSNGRAVVRSTDAGVSFTDMTNDAQTPPLGMHPDQHALVLNPADSAQAFIGSDGGVVRTNGTYLTGQGSTQCSGRGLTGDELAFCQQVLDTIPQRIESLNSGLNTLQFQSLSVNPTDPISDVQGGTQDNGTWLRDDSGSWFESVGGDGGQSGVNLSGTARMHTYFYSTGDVNFRGGDPLWWALVTGPLEASQGAGEGFSFYIPFIADPVVDGTWFTGGQYVWRTQDDGGSQAYLEANCLEMNLIAPDPSTCGDFERAGPRVSASASNFIVALARAPSDRSTLWVGLRQGGLFLSRNADAAAASVSYTTLTSATLPGRFVSGIVVDPADPLHAYISYSGYSAYTPSTPGHVFDVHADPVTGALTSTDISGNLGDQPITGIALDGQTGDLYASTDFGVARLPSGATSWSDSASGMPMTATYGLTMDAGARVLYAATHGRGAYQLALAPVVVATGPSTGTVGSAMAFSSTGSAGFGGLTYRWTFPDGTTSAQASPTWIPGSAVGGSVGLTVTDQAGGTAATSLPVTVSAAPAPTPTPTPTPTPLITQKPVHRLGLPARLSDVGWTRLLRLPVRTNAGQRAVVRVTGTPLATRLGPNGDQRRTFRVSRRNGVLRVWLSGTQATRVRVRLSADAVPGYTAYSSTTTYRTRRVR